MVIAMLIQSSSRTTVLTVDLVNTGFLDTWIDIIMGLNIGTTITAFIIRIDVETYALPIVTLGYLLIFF